MSPYESNAEKEEFEKAKAEWLAEGNKITVCPPGERSEEATNNPWARKKKPVETKETKKTKGTK
tara:strand:- start:856 stop:1047 length:192 start_codon:yes stop_codon:yes gene_type:complete